MWVCVLIKILGVSYGMLFNSKEATSSLTQRIAHLYEGPTVQYLATEKQCVSYKLMLSLKGTNLYLTARTRISNWGKEGPNLAVLGQIGPGLAKYWLDIRRSMLHFTI